MDRDLPRDWFYALMDYGAWVKKAYANPSRKSKHHAIQSPFAGSRRETRALALQALLSIGSSGAGVSAVRDMLPGPPRDPDELVSVLNDLVDEGFLIRGTEGYRVA